jgi:hypothetical protein
MATKEEMHWLAAIIGTLTAIIVLCLVAYLFGPRIIASLFDDGRASHPSEWKERR